MDAARIHLLFNHFPLTTSLIALIILLVGIAKKNKTSIKTGLLLNILAFIFTLPMYFSGAGTLEIVKNYSNISANSISIHTEYGEYSFISSFLLSISSAITLLIIPKKWYPVLQKIVLVLSFTTFILYSITAHLGGRVAHPELRNADKKLLDHFTK